MYINKLIMVCTKTSRMLKKTEKKKHSRLVKKMTKEKTARMEQKGKEKCHIKDVANK